MKTVYINRFDGGMTADARDDSNYAQLFQHFDNHATHKLTPYKSTSSAYASQSTAKIERMLTYNDKTYGYGLTAGGYAQVYESAAGAAIGTPNFAVSTTAADSSGTPDFGLFVEYKGVLYGATAGNRIWSYTISTNTFAGTTGGGGISYTNLGGGLVHSKSDILYIAIDNKIYYKNAASDIALGLTLPSNLIITSLTEYGNYLAIACRPLYSNAVNSRVFLWDRDTSLTTVSDTIDWGESDLFAIENLGGFIVGVSLKISEADTTGHKLVFSRYEGGGAIVFKEIPLATYYSISYKYVIRHKQKFNNKMYFALSATSSDASGANTGDYTGIWAVGRATESQPFGVTFDRLPNDDTYTQRINGFLMVSNYAFISYVQTDGTTYGLSQTIYANTYSATSKYRTVINPGMPLSDKFAKKQLMSVAVTYSPLPTAGQVVLKYRVDATPLTAWSSATTIFTETTDSVQVTEATSAGATEFTAGRDYEFQIESTGGAEITGIVYKYEVLETLI